jgi:uroporphyrin-3 C-methyltransferase
MNADHSFEKPVPVAELPKPEAELPPTTRPLVPSSRGLILSLGAVALAALASSGFLWQKISGMQEQLARQSADTGAQSLEARAVAKQAQELAREATARVAVFDARLSEVALQRTQLEELMQSLSRSRDENLVVDIESAIRLAQQQAQLTGSVEPLLAALKSADQRVTRAAQPRLTPLLRAIGRDIDRIKGAAVSDTPGLLVKLDELVRLADELVLANAVASVNGLDPSKLQAAGPIPTWWRRSLQVVLDEARGLLRVSRIEQADAALLSPEQSFFVRENFKLKLLNARLGLLARQLESSRADLAGASASLVKYFDANARKTQVTLALLQQVQMQMKTLQLPRVDETLAALTTAAAGR